VSTAGFVLYLNAGAAASRRIPTIAASGVQTRRFRAVMSGTISRAEDRA
jgi:hypothetical protein